MNQALESLPATAVYGGESLPMLAEVWITEHSLYDTDTLMRRA